MFGKGRGGGACDDDVIQHAHLHQLQCLLQPLGQCPVGTARLGITARVVVRNDDRRRVEPQRLLDQLARIHRCAVDGASEHLGVLDQPMLRVHEQHREHLMLEAGQLGMQVFLDRRRRCERRTALHLALNGLARGLQNLLGSRQQVAALRVTHHQRGIERGKGQLRHDRAPVARAELPGTVASTAQRKQSGIGDGHQAASVRARAVIDGENAVIR